MRVDKVTPSQDFYSYYDEIIAGMISCSERVVEDSEIDVNLVASIVKGELPRDLTNISGVEVESVYNFRNALNAVSLFGTLKADIASDARTVSVIATYLMPDLASLGDILEDGLEAFFKDWKHMNRKDTAMKYVLDKMANTKVFVRDNFLACYLFVLALCIESKEIPIIQRGDTFEELRGFVYGKR